MKNLSELYLYKIIYFNENIIVIVSHVVIKHLLYKYKYQRNVIFENKIEFLSRSMIVLFFLIIHDV